MDNSPVNFCKESIGKIIVVSQITDALKAVNELCYRLESCVGSSSAVAFMDPHVRSELLDLSEPVWDVQRKLQTEMIRITKEFNSHENS